MQSAPPRPAPPVVAEPDTVSLRIAEAAEKAAGALSTLSQVEQTQSGITPIEDFSGAPPEMMQEISLSWTGPIERVLDVLAKRAGYRLRFMGAQLPTPIVVTVDEYQQPLVKVIRSIAVQAGTKADVLVDSNQRIVEIRYASQSGH